MKKRRLVVTVFCFGLLAHSARAAGTGADRATAGSQSATSEINTIRSRYASSVLPADLAQMNHLHALSAKYAVSLLPNGSWPDIDYESTDSSVWPTSDHLRRTLVMAKSARLYRNKHRPNTALEAKVLLALKSWTDHDYRNPNWWWNEIGAPELTGEIATQMYSELSPAEISKIVFIMKRSDWRRVPWTGANLTWGVTNEIVRGCIENDPGAVAEGYERMYQEIKVVGPSAEGIQQDDSFHQHGVQLYSGGYGLNYANDVGRFLSFAWGTHYQIPPDRMAIFSSYLLDGEQWLIRGDVIDYSTIGREITRQGIVATPEDWTIGPISQAGPAYSLGNVVTLLAAEPSPRQTEFESFAARLRGNRDTPIFSGNKQFWCSDFMAHRRKAFYASVKMLSNRIQNAEITNGEGKESEHLSDGVNLLYLTGDEYKDIFPVWDWTKLPGTTAIQGTLDTGEKDSISTRGATPFNGGVSDGTYGMAAMDLSRGKLTARKAWFFFDDEYLCLGAGITLAGDSAQSVATDVNQTLLRGAVMTSQSNRPIADGTYAYTAGSAAWVYHNDVGYIFSPGSQVGLSVGSQSGTWSDIGSGSNQPVTLRVFDLWIDHGQSPQNGSYQYLVLPGASPKETMERARKPAIEVLANNDGIQAAWNDRLEIGMFAFRRPRSLKTAVGTIAVDHSCLLLIRRLGNAWKISAANPENLPLELHVSVGEREVTLDLPGGNFAGSSVSTTMRTTSATAVD